jgi:hypothetical protein
MSRNLTEQIRQVGKRHSAEAALIFAATLRDGTFLPCVAAHPWERHIGMVFPPAEEAVPKFDAQSLGFVAQARCIVHSCEIESVSEASEFLPLNLYLALRSTEYRGEFYSLRVMMKDGLEVTLWGGLGMWCYQPPQGYRWSDVAETRLGYDHHPVNPIRPRVVFECLVHGLSNTCHREARSTKA